MATLDAGLVALCPDTDADAVREILDTSLTDAQINAFLNTAYRITRPLHGHLAECGGVNAECDIIKYLAAHFIQALSDGGAVKSESIAGEWSVTYRGTDGMGLNSTMYGQTVLLMDCSGELAKLGKRKISIYVVDQKRLEDIDPSTL